MALMKWKDTRKKGRLFQAAGNLMLLLSLFCNSVLIIQCMHDMEFIYVQRLTYILSSKKHFIIFFVDLNRPEGSWMYIWIQVQLHLLPINYVDLPIKCAWKIVSQKRSEHPYECDLKCKQHIKLQINMYRYLCAMHIYWILSNSCALKKFILLYYKSFTNNS